MNFEAVYQAEFGPLKEKYEGQQIFWNGKVYRVVDYFFEGARGVIVGQDREGNEMHIFEGDFEIVKSRGCGRCGGSGRYSYNQMHGSRCYGCSGVGSQLLPPSGYPRQIKAVCHTDWERFYIKKGHNILADFVGFSKTGGTPLYRTYVEETSRTSNLLYNNMVNHFEFLGDGN